VSGWNCGWPASASHQNLKVDAAGLLIGLYPSHDDDDGAYEDGGVSGDAAFSMTVELC